MAHADPRLFSLAKRQDGVVSRVEAAAIGISDDQLRRRVAGGMLEQVGPNAFRLPASQHSAEAELRGLVADVGGVVWVSGPTACALYGWDGFALAPPFHLTIERGRQVRRAGHVIHTTKFLPADDQTTRSGFLTMKPARLLIDTARALDSEQLMTAAESAFRDGWCSDLLVRRKLAGLAIPARFGIAKLLGVLDERDRRLGAHSFLEREFLRGIELHGLPRPVCQQVLSRAQDRVVRVDFRFPGTSVVVEVLGYAFHRSKADLQRDAERLNALVLDGYRPLQFTYDDVVSHPDRMFATIRAALCERSPRPAR